IIGLGPTPPLTRVTIMSLFLRHAALQDLHSFPTRRSSDLSAAPPTWSRKSPPRPASRAPAWNRSPPPSASWRRPPRPTPPRPRRSEEHTSELQSRENLVCRLLLEKKKTNLTSTLPSTSRFA